MHRHYSSALLIVSGHRCEVDDISLWAACLKKGGTVVILMGIGKTASITSRLLAAAVPPDLSVAVIVRGSYLDEEVFQTTLGRLQRLADRLRLPGLIVLGRVAEFRTPGYIFVPSFGPTGENCFSLSQLVLPRS